MVETAEADGIPRATRDKWIQMFRNDGNALHKISSSYRRLRLLESLKSVGKFEDIGIPWANPQV